MRLLFVALVMSAALLYYSSAADASIAPRVEPSPEPDTEPGKETTPESVGIIGELQNMLAKFTVPAKYASTIEQAEKTYALPSGLLARVLYRESRFREDIISGQVRSSAGAIGIAQFMPATSVSLGVNPLDPFDAIEGAARYLSQLHRTTGSWTEAVAAYNWGIGNVQRKGLARAPQETRDYLSEIIGNWTA